MGALDVIILVIVCIAAVYGAVRGLVHQAGTIIAVVLGVLVCRFGGARIAAMIVEPGAEYEGVYRVLVYVLVFVAVFFCVRFLATLFARTLSKMHIRVIDRVAGAVFSVALWVLIMSALVNVYFAAVPGEEAKFSRPGYPWRVAVVRLAPALLGYISTDSGK